MNDIKNRLLNQEVFLVLLLIIVFLFLSSFDIGRNPTDLHQFRQTQTLSTIYNYFIDGIDLFRPQIDTNGSHSVVILEFPLYQAFSALIMKVFGFSELICRLINLTIVITTGVMLAKLVENFIAKGAFLFVMVIFLLNPAVIFWSSTILIDPLSLLLPILSVYLYCGWLRTGRITNLIYAVVLGCLAMTVKITGAFVPFSVFYTYTFLIEWRKYPRKTLIILFISAVFMTLVFLSWNYYSRYMNTLNPHMYTTSSVEWYFGTMQQRFSSVVWSELITRLINNNFAFFGLIGLLITAWSCKFKLSNRMLAVSLLSILFSYLYLFIFINLNYVHTYYQLPISIANALVGGIGLSVLVNLIFTKLRSENVQWQLLTVMFGILTFYAAHNLYYNWKDLSPLSSPYDKSECEYEIGGQIRAYLEELGVNTRLIGVVHESEQGCWNGPHALMYYLKRRGYVVNEINNSDLSREKLDLIIAIYKGGYLPEREREGWVSNRGTQLLGKVRAYEFKIFTPGNDVSDLSSTVHIDANKDERASFLDANKDAHVLGRVIVKGEKNIRFNTKLRLHDLNIPAYSKVNVSFSLRTIPYATDNPGYFIMRTYTGGYAFDQNRSLSFSESNDLKTFSFSMETGLYDDYVLEFGQINDGGYELVSPITIEYRSIFEIQDF